MGRAKAPKDPKAPKKPQSSYFLFSNERRSILAKENPTKKITEISQLISAEWKSLSPDQKEPYVKKAKQLKDEHKVIMDEYKQTEDYKKHQIKLEEWKANQKATENFKLQKKKKQKNNNNDSENDEIDSDVSMIDDTTTKKKKLSSKKKKKKLPKKPKQPKSMPKRPQSSYFLFSNERRPQLKEQYPEKKITELSKLISLEWKSKTEEEKQPYFDRAAELKKVYDPEMAVYKQSEEYQQYLAEKKEYAKQMKNYDKMDVDSEDEKIKVSLPRKPKDKNAPKKPLTSYFLFAKEVRQSIKEENPECKITEIAKIIGNKWKSVPEDEKNRYEQKAKEAKKKYDVEIEAYNASEEKAAFDAKFEAWKNECIKRKQKARDKLKKQKEEERERERRIKNKQKYSSSNKKKKNMLNKRKRKSHESSSDADSDSDSESDSDSDSGSNDSNNNDSDSDDGSSSSSSGDGSSSNNNDSDDDSDDSSSDDNNNNGGGGGHGGHGGGRSHKSSTNNSDSSSDDGSEESDSDSE